MSEEVCDTTSSKKGSLRIHKILLTNYRRFIAQEFSFHPQFTVLIGNNAAGKTSILDCLASGLGEYIEVMNPEWDRPIASQDVRVVYYQKGGMPNPEPQDPTRVECAGEGRGYQLQWERFCFSDGKNWITQRNKAIGIKRMVSEVNSYIRLCNIAQENSYDVREGHNITLPLIAYYGAGRLWKSNDPDIAITGPESRLTGYKDCLNAGVANSLFMEWFKRLEFIALQENRKLGALESVRQAIRTCIPKCKEIAFRVQMDDLIITFEDGSISSLRSLSDGFRSMITMVGDIAQRAARLNPHLEDQAALQTGGVVLIDEIDLHLHPIWQRTVVEDLRKAFPLMQFIATTHSPIIIQSMQPGEIIDLGSLPGTIGAALQEAPVTPAETTTAIEQPSLSPTVPDSAEPSPSAPYSDHSIEEILENMGVKDVKRSEKNIRMREAAEKYFGLLQQSPKAPKEEIEKARQERDALIEPYKSEVAFYTFLKMKEAAAGLGEEPSE